jgi:hypothetical protein
VRDIDVVDQAARRASHLELVEATVDHQPIEPGFEAGIAAEAVDT